MHDDDMTLSPALRSAVEALRESDEPRDEWRTGVLDAIARQDVEPVRGTRWSLRPSAAIAAALAFAALGSAGTYAALARERAAPLRAPAAAVVAAAAPKSVVRFAVVAPGAVKVTLVGDFNAWNPAALPMQRSPNGQTWEVEVPLSPGRYAYAFVVDGHLARDPAAAEAAHDDFGVPSSVLLVKGS